MKKKKKEKEKPPQLSANLNFREKMLFEWVSTVHKNQYRKYTNEPYITHLLSVAAIASFYSFDKREIIKSIALCHDIIEDQPVTYPMLHDKLFDFGYSQSQVQDIVAHVRELSDVFTKEAYPDLNRTERGLLEAKRLSKISATASTVKYADIIDNLQSITHYDPGFSVTYLKEIGQYLYQIDTGNSKLYQDCIKVYESAKKFFKI